MSKSTNTPAYWLAEDACPAWCDGLLHRDGDALEDRTHYSSATTVIRMTMHESIRHDGRPSHGVVYLPLDLQITTRQRYREVAPHVVISPEHVEHGPEYRLTIAEALKLVQALTLACDVAEGHCAPASISPEMNAGCHRGAS